MRWIKAALLFLGFCSTIWGGTVHLVNDSSIKLRAEIRAADGTYLGEVIVPPQQSMQWNSYFGAVGHQQYADISQTPYRVLWFCSTGEQNPFSICDNVSSGSTVTALYCSGNRECPPQLKQENPPLYGQPRENYLPGQLQQQQQQQTEQEAGPPEGMQE